MTEKINLSSEVKEFIERIEAAGAKPLYEMTAEEAREFLSELQKKDFIDIEAELKDITILTEYAGEVSVRIAKPKKNSGEKLPAIIYAHGGGWVMGDKEVFGTLIKKLAIETNSAVFFVEYSRSPKAKYPTALNEIYGVMDYVYYKPQEFNIDNEKMAIAGDSAGANMAAATIIRAKLSSGPQMKAQVLYYPVCDASMKTNSYNEFKNGPWLTKKAMEYFFEAYLPDERLRDDKYISILKAPIEDLKGLPPAIIITAENDVLRDEGEEYARRLDEAGVEVINFRVNGTIHDFMMLNALQNTCQTKSVLRLTSALLKEIFNKQKPD